MSFTPNGEEVVAGGQSGDVKVFNVKGKGLFIHGIISQGFGISIPWLWLERIRQVQRQWLYESVNIQT